MLEDFTKFRDLHLSICLLCLHYARSLPIMPALCLTFWHAYYALNYAEIIGAGLVASRFKYGMLIFNYKVFQWQGRTDIYEFLGPSYLICISLGMAKSLQLSVWSS